MYVDFEVVIPNLKFYLIPHQEAFHTFACYPFLPDSPVSQIANGYLICFPMTKLFSLTVCLLIAYSVAFPKNKDTHESMIMRNIPWHAL